MREIGTFRITDLSDNQCRFPCTEIPNVAERHRFCGAQTRIQPGNLNGSYCDDHLKIVWGRGTSAERKATDWDSIRRVA